MNTRVRPASLYGFDIEGMMSIIESASSNGKIVAHFYPSIAKSSNTRRTSPDRKEPEWAAR